ncbi:MAG: putative cell wall-binding domain, partial [Frankiales bacterium]|nr:putative cell wall-binding domain [Frankiales bacterium]
MSRHRRTGAGPGAAKTQGMRSLLAATTALSLTLLAAPAVAQEQATVTEEMAYCASLGAKRPGYASTATYVEHLAGRFRAAGLDTRVEQFHVPRYDVEAERIEVVGAGARRVPGEVFAFSGTGTVQAPVVYVGTGRAQEYAGKDVRGKIVLVDRNEAFHRTAQLREVEAQGGAAMLYVSGTPDNLVQTGTVRFAQDTPARLVAMTVGMDDGAALKDQLDAGPLTMRLSVRASRVDAVGKNVIGVRKGTTHPDRYVVVAGHHDSWHGGAVDNCSGMGSLLQLVEQTRDLDPAYTVVYAAWDAEEIGLTGSYDFVRRHPDVVDRTVVVENLEMTSAATYAGGQQLPTSLLNLMFGTTSPAMNAVVYGAATRAGFTPVPTTANGVRSISGGIIPTDLQPFYARGVQGFSTFSSSPYYHTTQESPDKIDPASHVRVTDCLRNVLTDLQAVPPQALALREVPRVVVTAPAKAAAGQAVPVTVTVTDPAGRAVDDVGVRVLVNQRDHWAVTAGAATPLGGGRYRYTVPAGTTKADTTWLTATVDEQLYQAQGFAKVDQTVRAAAPAATASSRPVAAPAASAPSSGSLPSTGGT